MDIIIKKISPELLDDYLFFFDNMVFSENPDWSKCYCYSFHFTGPDESWNKKANRAAVSKMIQEDKLRGYLAYSNNTAVGWCNANDRNNYQSLRNIYTLDEDSEAKICSVVCFLISPEFRRKGIAKLLLDRIIEDYGSNDYEYLEAYPLKDDHSCEKNYRGPLGLYEENNFKLLKEFDKYRIVRREL